MRKIACLFCLICSSMLLAQEVVPSKKDTAALIKKALKASLEKDISYFGASIGNEVFIRAFKSEYQLELWIKKDTTFYLFRTYPICNWSGDLGPKRKQGDMQVPEGFYVINRFNPNSDYHLSMGINYPNASDLHFADMKRPGGAIYIHGSCGSHGCIPVGDDNIEEVYWLAWKAFQKGQKQIPVHIFPCRLTEGKMHNLLNRNIRHRFFWENLEPVYQYFEQKRTIPLIEIETTGRYRIKE